MKTFKQHLNEGTDKEMLAAIEALHKKAFPKGWFKGNVKNGLGGGHTISFSFGIVPENEVPNKILDNDPGIHQFVVHIKEDEYEAKFLRGGVYIVPEEGVNLAMQKVKTKFRKSKGSYDKVLKGFATWFPKMKKIVTDNKDNIYGGDRYSKGVF
jgi:hypothetical protein